MTIPSLRTASVISSAIAAFAVMGSDILYKTLFNQQCASHGVSWELSLPEDVYIPTGLFVLLAFPVWIARHNHKTKIPFIFCFIGAILAISTLTTAAGGPSECYSMGGNTPLENWQALVLFVFPVLLVAYYIVFLGNIVAVFLGNLMRRERGA